MGPGKGLPRFSAEAEGTTKLSDLFDQDPADDSPDKREVAVALHYDEEKDNAPKVIASGKGALAERILEIAFQTGAKVRKDEDLAELLSALEIGSEIPLEAFSAVAEILAYVYRANQGRQTTEKLP